MEQNKSNNNTLAMIIFAVMIGFFTYTLLIAFADEQYVQGEKYRQLNLKVLANAESARGSEP